LRGADYRAPAADLHESTIVGGDNTLATVIAAALGSALGLARVAMSVSLAAPRKSSDCFLGAAAFGWLLRSR